MGKILEKLAQVPSRDLPGLKLPEGTVAISETDPLRILDLLLCAMKEERRIALINPAWPRSWKDELSRLATTHKTGRDGLILVPTSGSSGLPKFCVHDLATLASAAEGFFHRFSATGCIHSVNLLPLYHIGGLMPVFRAAVPGGKVHFADYRDPSSIEKAPFPLEEASTSLVPTQLHRMLQHREGTRLLRCFGIVLIGGAACPPELLQQARREGIRLAPSYGSTETAAMVTAMDPDAFLSGGEGSGKALPHVALKLDADSRIVVSSMANFRGYFPDHQKLPLPEFQTSDLGSIDPEGNLHVLGRADRIIISGGEKVNPELVEQVALNSGFVNKARCRGLPDKEWGNRVELWIEAPASQAPDLSALEHYLKKNLPPHAVPKRIHLAGSLPGNLKTLS